MKILIVILFTFISALTLAQDKFQQLGFSSSDFKLSIKHHIPDLKLYHGTKIQNVSSILKHGLEASTHGHMGPGIYGYSRHFKDWTRMYGDQMIVVDVLENTKVIDLSSRNGKKILKAFHERFPGRANYEIADYLGLDGIKYKRVISTIDFVFHKNKQLTNPRLYKLQEISFKDVVVKFSNLKSVNNLYQAMSSFYGYYQLAPSQLDKLVYEVIQDNKLINVFDNIQTLDIPDSDLFVLKFSAFHLYYTEILIRHIGSFAAAKLMLTANTLNLHYLKKLHNIENKLSKLNREKINSFFSSMLIDSTEKSLKKIRDTQYLRSVQNIKDIIINSAKSKILTARLSLGFLMTTFLISPTLLGIDIVMSTNLLNWDSYLWINAILGALTTSGILSEEHERAKDNSLFLKKSLERLQNIISCNSLFKT